MNLSGGQLWQNQYKTSVDAWQSYQWSNCHIAYGPWFWS